MEKANINDLFYYIKKPQGIKINRIHPLFFFLISLFFFFNSIGSTERETSQNTATTTNTTSPTTTECLNTSHSHTSTRSDTPGTKNLKLSDFDLSSTYDKFVRPYKEKGVKMDPTYFPYINSLPGN